MNNYEQRLAALTSEQRALFEKRLKAKMKTDASTSAPLPPVTETVSVQTDQEMKHEDEKIATQEFLQGVQEPLQFSLMFFSDDSQSASDKYELVLKAARYADQHGFTAIWTPERHLHRFGGQYPNPAVLSAALAVITDHIHIRAGSVVLPLHHPLRIVEEWSVVDNLSHGRIGLSVASGWVPDDFILSHGTFARRRETMLEDLTIIQKLWHQETVRFSSPEHHEVDAQAFPAPCQAELPLWITSSGNPETWLRAGELGVNVLTALMQQSLEEVAEKVSLYRAARARHGHDPNTGIVTLMIHTFIWDDPTLVYQKVHKPLTDYLRTHTDMRKQMARAMGKARDAERFTADDDAFLAEHAFKRYFNHNGLFGTPQSSQAMLQNIQQSGVNEIACLIDFGIDTETMLESLNYLNQAKVSYQQQNKRAADSSI